MIFLPRSKVKVTAKVKLIEKQYKCRKSDEMHRKLKIIISKFSYTFLKNLSHFWEDTQPRSPYIFHKKKYFWG